MLEIILLRLTLTQSVNSGVNTGMFGVNTGMLEKPQHFAATLSLVLTPVVNTKDEVNSNTFSK